MPLVKSLKTKISAEGRPACGGQRKIVFIVGPTAVGKSEIAVKLSEKLDAEIISCDSMQVYKGMDIITSKPSQALRKKIKHHLMNIISPGKEYDVSRYRREALKKIEGILRRKRLPVFAGGTGLYMSALIDGLFELKCKSKAVRKRLFKLAESRGSLFLYKRLQDIDPEAAARIHPHDTKRIVRALEVFVSTGQTISCLQKKRSGLSRDYDTRIFCLNMEREKLNIRIERRVDKMFKEGLVREVRRLLKARLSRTAAFAIGIRELKGYFDGHYDLQEARRLIIKNTRQYAKRQLTWFRKDKRIQWIDVVDNATPVSVAKNILSKI